MGFKIHGSCVIICQFWVRNCNLGCYPLRMTSLLWDIRGSLFPQPRPASDQVLELSEVVHQASGTVYKEWILSSKGVLQEMSKMSLSCWPHVHKEYFELDEPDKGGTSFETWTFPVRGDSFWASFRAVWNRSVRSSTVLAWRPFVCLMDNTLGA